MSNSRRAEPERSGSPGASGSACPECGGRLSEPVSSALHCFRKCARCGQEFELDDPRLA